MMPSLITEWRFVVKGVPVAIVPGDVSATELVAYTGRVTRTGTAYYVENRSDSPMKVHFRYIDGSWSYNGTPDMSKVEFLRVFLQLGDDARLQFAIEKGQVTKESGADNPIVLQPGQRATLWAEILLKDANPDDKVGYKLELEFEPAT